MPADDPDADRFEREGRAAVAAQLARWCQRHGHDVDRVVGWSAGQWLAAAQAAKVSSAVKRRKVPSDRTRRLVLALLTPSPVPSEFYAGKCDEPTEED